MKLHQHSFFEATALSYPNLIAVDDHGKVDLLKLRGESNLPILMTPKDAVKYDHEFPKNSWVVQPSITFDNENELIEIIKQLASKSSEIN